VLLGFDVLVFANVFLFHYLNICKPSQDYRKTDVIVENVSRHSSSSGAYYSR